MNTCDQIERLNLKFIRLDSQNRQPENIVLSEGQKKIINFLDNKPLSVIKHSRGIGASTALILYILANALYPKNKNKQFCFIRPDYFYSKCAYDLTKNIIKLSLSEEDRKQITFKKSSIVFPNNNVAYFSTPKILRNRDKRFDAIIGDTAAFFEFNIGDAKDLLNKNGRICFVSTPHGIGNDFAKLWTNTKDDEHLSITFMDTFWQGTEYAEKMKQYCSINTYFEEICGWFIMVGC